MVRGERTLVVGVDIAKSKHWAQCMDGLTELPVGSPFAFKNTREGFLRLLQQLFKAQAQVGAVRILVGMEPSGHYWRALAWFLREQEITVVTVSPLHVKRAKEFDDNSPTKNDRKDAWTIARRVNDGDFFEPYLPEGVYADLRALTQTRQQQRTKLNAALNQLHAILDEFFPEFTTVFADPLGLAALYVLSHAPFPCDILATKPEDFAQALHEASNGRVGAKRALKLRETARLSIGVKHGLNEIRRRLSQCLAEVNFCKAQLCETEIALADALQQTGLAPYLLSVPGVGVVTAATFLGETGDLARYTDWRQLRKLAGFNLKENSSGNKNSRTRITKRGRPGLRCLLYQAAMILVAKNRQFKAFFQYLKTREQNPLKGKQALIAAACKLLRVLFALARSKRCYDPSVVLGEFRTTQIGLAA
jgi:transposase